MHNLTYDGGDAYKAVLINGSVLFLREGLIHPSFRVVFTPTRLSRANANTPRYVKTLYWLSKEQDRLGTLDVTDGPIKEVIFEIMLTTQQSRSQCSSLLNWSPDNKIDAAACGRQSRELGHSHTRPDISSGRNQARRRHTGQATKQEKIKCMKMVHYLALLC